MTVKLNFDDWWSDFNYEFRNDKDGGSEQLKRLISEVSGFNAENRETFINELLQRENLRSYACILITEFGTEQQIQLIKDKAQELINNNSNDNILQEYLRVILKRYQPQDISILSKYFIENQSKQIKWIPVELFEIDKNLFLKAFAIEIEKYPIDDLCNYDGLLYMTKHLDALEYLIRNLPFTLSEKLKLFVLSKINHSITQKDKNLKNRLIELSDFKQSEIEYIKKIRLNALK